jgi:hypothetical protein
MADLCEILSAKVQDLARGKVADNRIGPRFLRHAQERLSLLQRWLSVAGVGESRVRPLGPNSIRWSLNLEVERLVGMQHENQGGAFLAPNL